MLPRSALLCLVVSAACAPVQMVLEPAVPICRSTVPRDAPVQWVMPFDADDREKLYIWCEAVGPIALHDPGGPPTTEPRPLVIVSWNMAVGGGNLNDLVAEVRSATPSAPHLILLLQEAYRTRDVPSRCPTESGVGGRLGPPRGPGSVDILDLARNLSMHAVYVPSMRNGADCVMEPLEDRGNAILSTLPLTDIVAIELPFAQQRRVAAAARVHTEGRIVGLVSVHFDTLRGHRQQATGLRKTLDALGWPEAVVIAGDFNARRLDPGVGEMREHFHEVACGTGPTHEGLLRLRLDRMFTRGLENELDCRTGTMRYGSDHNPLIARVLPLD
jgi:endonuclease/exonuclease/phosphatase family metal-dependent hydrolase